MFRYCLEDVCVLLLGSKNCCKVNEWCCTTEGEPSFELLASNAYDDCCRPLFRIVPISLFFPSPAGYIQFRGGRWNRLRWPGSVEVPWPKWRTERRRQRWSSRAGQLERPLGMPLGSCWRVGSFPWTSPPTRHFLRRRLELVVLAAVLCGLLPFGIPRAAILGPTFHLRQSGPHESPSLQRQGQEKMARVRQNPRCQFRRPPGRRRRHFVVRKLGQQNSWWCIDVYLDLCCVKCVEVCVGCWKEQVSQTRVTLGIFCGVESKFFSRNFRHLVITTEGFLHASVLSHSLFVENQKQVFAQNSRELCSPRVLRSCFPLRTMHIVLFNVSFRLALIQRKSGSLRNPVKFFIQVRASTTQYIYDSTDWFDSNAILLGLARARKRCIAMRSDVNNRTTWRNRSIKTTNGFCPTQTIKLGSTNREYNYIKSSIRHKQFLAPLNMKNATMTRNDDITEFSVDKADYSALQDLFLGLEYWTHIAKMVTIHADADCRVCKLRCPKDWTSLRPSIGQLKSLQELDLSCIKLDSLPATIGNLASLAKLDLHESKIESLPPSIGRLQSLQELDLRCTSKLKGLPDEIGNLGSLIKLILYESKIESLPPSIGRLHSLKELDLSYTPKLKGLPDEIGNLGSLIKLNLWGSKIESLPSSIGRLQSLQELDLSYTSKLKRLPDEIGNLGSLIKLYLLSSSIELLPPSIGRLQTLRELDLRCTSKLKGLPAEIGNLGSLIKLILYESKIESLPPSIGRLQSLRELNLRFTSKLKVLPDEIGNLGSLIKLNFCAARIESLPPSIGRLHSLEELDLSYTSKLKVLPDEIGNLGTLIKLYLCQSKIESLPPSIGRLQSLRELDLSYTSKLKGLPAEIGNLSSLIKLDLCAAKIESFPPLLEYALACNRFMCRAAMAPVETRLMTMGWPLLLGNARLGFRPFASDRQWVGLEEPDAIYCILAYFRGYFVEAITSAHVVAS